MATVVGALRQTRGALSGHIGGWLFYGIGLLAFLLLILPRILHDPTFFFQILVLGLTDGAIYALIALGYTMVYGIIELINFAHGDVFTLGGFIGILVFSLVGLVPNRASNLGLALVPIILGVMVVTMLLTGMVNVTIERIAYRPLRHAPRLAALITAVGMSFILEGIMFVWKGPNFVQSPSLLPAGGVVVAGVRIDASQVIVVLVAVALMVLLTYFVEFTRLGRAMRATAQDRDAALLMGIDINRTISLTFFIGAALAAAGGIMYGFYFNNLRYDTGFSSGLTAFTAAVFGGIGNIQGAALGALILGLIRAFNDSYGQAAWTDVLVFSILILVLTLRPTGLLGMRVPEK
ncbi:MAG TPA: branched-chain amino acid ABC transporter permease [Candidatus Dormibacteraeota bacterium]|nr:branched-chain amino acid ABC transporter permease [Candidatus Dormibacteraeota bacterium]